MDNLRGLLGIRKMDRILNEWIRELYRVMKGVDEKIDESILLWFGHVERMEKDRILIVAQWVGCGRDGLIL